jgi:hypothetical protein
MYRAYASSGSIWALIVYSMVLVGLIVWHAMVAFPQVVGTDSSVTPGWELHLLGLIASAGGIGGLLHLVTSLGNFVGTRQLLRSWLLFYYLRPWVGAGLGIVFYFVLRTGVLNPAGAANTQTFNVYGLLAMSALAGMFSRQAMDKLAEVFEVLFQKTKEDLQSRSASQLFGRGGSATAATERLPASTMPAGGTFANENVTSA